MKILTLAFALLASVGLAQAASHETHAAMHQGMGVVKAIKSDKMRITHEPIPSLEWPAMTMWFDLKGHAGHDIKVGDRVHFEMMQGAKKKWVLEKIERK